ncbi:hypothetical protein BVC71_05500 [Marivivens niveibacter]|uniref:Uncharacterized protein n=2 Tax=Marivivens niveibacter TaxID=1930667 RepID=A0A251X2W8_9RHOB|nr:hypothetical protein BVC71_05500 [Marivivens niveibacter]
MGMLDEMADKIAVKALKDEAVSGDDQIVKQVGEILGASSQTLQEAYNTAIRVRRAERRANELLDKRAAKFKPEAN